MTPDRWRQDRGTPVADNPSSHGSSNHSRSTGSDTPNCSDTARHAAFEVGADGTLEPAEWAVPETGESPDEHGVPDLAAGNGHTERSEAAHTPRNPTVFTWFVRRRIRAAWVQGHRIGVARMRAAKNPADVAGWVALGLELKALAEARRHGTGSDIRAALLDVACTCVLLGERVDRPKEPATGTRRKQEGGWYAMTFDDELGE